MDEFTTSPTNEYSSSPPPDNENDTTENEETNNDWVAYQDDNGQTYYYNNKTGESSWTLPPSFEADEMKTDEVEAQQQDEIEAEENNEEQVNTEDGENQSDWVAYKDDEGREYYYNSTTGETQWDKPEDMMTTQDEPQSPPIEELQEDQMETQIEEEDPVEKSIKTAQEFLSQPDAILEPNCIQYVSDLVTNLGPEEGGPKAMQLLTSSFYGYTAICGQLALWLARLSYSNKVGNVPPPPAIPANSIPKKETKTEPKKAVHYTQNDSANIPRKIAEQIIQKLTHEKFTKLSGDNILKLSKQEAIFLEQMIDIPSWRSLLIDLASKYSNSALLMYCLQSISKKGHHREITKRVKGSTTSDYFVVFNAMLMSELVVLGKMAVGGSVGDHEVVEIGMDLKRSCGSTSYTFIYALELLEELIQKASQKVSSEKKQSHRSIGLSRAIRKWERFKEDLIDSMVVDSSSSSASFTCGNGVSSGAVSQIVKKRKVDVTLCVMDYYQDKKRVKDDDKIDGDINGDDDNSKLHSAILCILKNYAYSKVMDTSTANELLLPPQSENEEPTQLSKHHHKIGELLTNNASAIISLLGNLFKTGSFRMRSTDDRKLCAKLIALSVIASKRKLLCKNEKKEEGEEEEEDEKRLKEKEEEDEIAHLVDVLIKGCALTEKLENMVGFTVSDDPTPIQNNAYLLLDEKMSPGRQLTFLVKHNPVVAQGVLIWSIDLSHGREFVTSAAYPTLAPSLLSLIRIMSIYHPFSRQVVLQLTLTFLHHNSNKELSYAKSHAIKQQALRLLLFLSTQGLALAVFCSIYTIMQVSSSDIDSALLRYFIKGCLDIILPPISLPLVRVMGKLLLTKLCKEALCSSYFEQMDGDEGTTEEKPRFAKCKTAKDQLMRFVGFMNQCVEEEKKFGSGTALVTEEDESMMAILISTYGCA